MNTTNNINDNNINDANVIDNNAKDDHVNCNNINDNVNDSVNDNLNDNINDNVNDIEKDDHILDILWEGKIPILFKLNENEIGSNCKPDPRFILASRLSYLPIVSCDVLSYLQSFALLYTSTVWYEYNDQPLKSNVPIGIIIFIMFIIIIIIVTILTNRCII